MLLLLLTVESMSLSPQLVELARRARESAARQTTHSHDTPYLPGQYDLGGVSFTLTRTLIGETTDPVRGFAMDDTVLAVASSGTIGEGTVFVDSSRQRLLDVSDKFEEDRDVSFYNISSVNPLTVFTNLRMRTAVDTANYDCSFSGSEYIGAKCQANASYNWNDAENRPNTKEFEESPGMYHRLGAKVQASGYVDISFNGVANMKLDYGFEAKADACALVFDSVKLLNLEAQICQRCVSLYMSLRRMFGASS